MPFGLAYFEVFDPKGLSRKYQRAKCETLARKNKENIYTRRSLQLIQKTNIKEQQSKMLTSVSKYCKELEIGHSFLFGQ